MSDFVFKKNEFNDRSFILAGRKTHFFQYIDGGFRTKWTGMWVPPFKYFDYYIYNVNDSWLDLGTASSFKYYSGFAVRNYKLPCFNVNETLFIPDNHNSLVSILKIKNHTKKECPFCLKLDLGINIRKKDENWHTRGYDISSDNLRNLIIVSANDKNTFFSAGIGKIDLHTLNNLSISFNNRCDYRDHYPGGEKQRVMDIGSYEINCMIEPGEVLTIPFIFTGSDISQKHVLDEYDSVMGDIDNLFEKKKTLYENYSSNILECPDSSISQAFTSSAVCMKDFIHDSKNCTGIFAGYPWFLEFWGRDTFWSLLGLIDAGDFKNTRKILIDYVKNYDNKKGLPTLISTENEKKYYSNDIDPLFLIASNYYINMSGDDNFVHKIKPVAQRMIKKIRIESKIIHTDPDGTWMDTYKRIGNAVDVQSLWIEALKYYDKNKSNQLKVAVEILYWNRDTRYLYDTYGSSKDPIKTINPAILLMFDHLSPFKTRRALDIIREEFTTPFGARTRGMNENEYCAEAYHKGSCWGLTTGWAACAFFRHHFNGEGLDMLHSISQYIAKDTIGALPETVSAFDGKNLGATMQAWSSAMYIHAVDHYMLGISVDSKKKLITISPHIPHELDNISRKSKKIHNNFMDLSIVHDSHKYNVSIKFRNNPDFSLRLVLPGRIRSINYNDKKSNGNIIKLRKTKKEMLFEGVVHN